jgi:hypothetical protein
VKCEYEPYQTMHHLTGQRQTMPGIWNVNIVKYEPVIVNIKPYQTKHNQTPPNATVNMIVNCEYKPYLTTEHNAEQRLTIQENMICVNWIMNLILPDSTDLWNLALPNITSQHSTTLNRTVKYELWIWIVNMNSKPNRTQQCRTLQRRATPHKKIWLILIIFFL